jgi:hypothetical protein
VRRGEVPLPGAETRSPATALSSRQEESEFPELADGVPHRPGLVLRERSDDASRSTRPAEPIQDEQDLGSRVDFRFTVEILHDQALRTPADQQVRVAKKAARRHRSSSTKRPPTPYSYFFFLIGVDRYRLGFISH